MNEITVQRYDRSDMRRLLLEFPQQIEEAVAIGKSAKIPLRGAAIKNVVVTGLGGSAIGGDILRSYAAGELGLPFIVNRYYELPAFVGKESLVIVSSYSGGTEETISAHHDAKKKKAAVIGISTGGETQELCRKFKQPFVKIPKGYPPRAALGFSFFVPLLLLTRLKLLPSKEKEIRETVKLLTKKAKVYAMLKDTNPAYALAKQLYNKLPVVYSSSEAFDAVNVRWRGQLAENAKVLAFGHVLPEMNHNELVGWKVLQRHMHDMAVVFLRDKGEHARVRARMEITRSIVSEFAGRVLSAESDGSSKLARIFSLVQLGDWTSYYLALLNGIDPTPVRIIDYLKWEMGKR